MTSPSRHQNLSLIVILAAVATLSAASSATAWAQGFRIGSSGGGWNSGGAGNLGRVINSVTRQAQGQRGGQYRTLPYVPVAPTQLVSPIRRPGPSRVTQPVVCPTDPQPTPAPPPPHPRPAKPTYPVTQPAQPLTPEERAREHVLAARQAFEQQDYQQAFNRINQAVELVPKNQDARQFRSLILFAMPKYQQAAADAYDAFLLGPAWTWETLRSLYSETSIYTRQFRQLQQEATRRPESLEVQFLLAYHYLMLGHLKHGEAQLVKVLEIRPDEPVSQQLLQAVRAAQNGPETQSARK